MQITRSRAIYDLQKWADKVQLISQLERQRVDLERGQGTCCHPPAMPGSSLGEAKEKTGFPPAKGVPVRGPCGIEQMEAASHTVAESQGQ